MEAEKAVRQIIQNAKNSDGYIRIIDAYSGIGTISLPLAANGLETIGIESNHESYKLSQFNAFQNELTNVKFIYSDVLDFLKTNLLKSDYLIVDPPRKGLDRELLDLIRYVRPINIAYMSCNPSTLSRDLLHITSNNLHKVQSVFSYDFFPQTTHVEALVFLKLSNL